jgi:hypothetical protein
MMINTILTICPHNIKKIYSIFNYSVQYRYITIHLIFVHILYLYLNWSIK